MKILAENGRNKHQQRLVRAECACGRIVESVIYNNIKNGRTKTCGKCRKSPAPKVVAVIAQEIAPVIPSQSEHGSVAWFAEQIAVKEAAALVAEKRVLEWDVFIRDQEDTDLDSHKKRKAEASHAKDLRAEIARLQTAKDKAESALVNEVKTQSELNRERIAALRGDRK